MRLDSVFAGTNKALRDVYHSAPAIKSDDGKRVMMPGHILAVGAEGERTAKFRASTPALDRHKTIVRTEGIDTTNYAQNPIFGWGHDVYSYSPIENIIGKVTGWQQDANRFDIDVEFTPPGTNPMGEMAYRMVKGGFVNMVSIGFIEKKAGYQEVEGFADQIYVYDETELLEVSLVPIPSNPEAKVITNALASKYLDDAAPADAADIAATIGARVRELDAIRAIRDWRPRGTNNHE